MFAPYDAPAGGWGALHATARALREQSVEIRGTRALLSMNQPEGFETADLMTARALIDNFRNSLSGDRGPLRRARRLPQ